MEFNGQDSEMAGLAQRMVAQLKADLDAACAEAEAAAAGER